MKQLIGFTLLLVLLAAVVAGLAPLLLKMTIDSLDSHSAEVSSLTPIYLIATYAFIHWSSRSVAELRNMYFGRIDQRIQRRLSDKLFAHLMALPFRFHIDRETGALSQILSNGLLGYRMLLHHGLLTLLPVIVELGSMCLVLVLLGHPAFLVITCTAVLFYLCAFRSGVAGIGEPARAVSRAHINAYAILTDAILNYETVKYFGMELHVRRRFFHAVTKLEGQWSEVFRQRMKNGLAVAAIFVLSLGVSMVIAAREVQQGAMSIGDFVLVNAYLIQITRPLEMLGLALRDIAQAAAFIENMIELLAQRREREHNDHRIAHLASRPPELVFDHVSYSYRGDRCVLKEVSFTVPSGKTLAVVGASGSGKSSLVRLLLGMVEPSAGQIRLNDCPLSNIALSALRSTIAVVPQDLALFNGSIAYNIAFGDRNSTDADIVSAAKAAQIHDFILGLPDGYETKVGERGFRLSGGERQRIAIARAVLRKPKMFVLDEATSALDTNTEVAILGDLLGMTEAATTLLIAHRLSTVAQADEIIVLDGGMIVERGVHEELLRRGLIYAAMWHGQHQGPGNAQRLLPV